MVSGGSNMVGGEGLHFVGGYRNMVATQTWLAETQSWLTEIHNQSVKVDEKAKVDQKAKVDPNTLGGSSN